MPILTAFTDRWLSAWTGNRPQQLLEFYTNDAFYLDPANPEGLQGKAQMLPYFTKLLARNPDWEWKAVEVIPTAEGFTLKWQARIPVGSSTLTLQGLDIVELRDGRISRNEVYFDRQPWLKALADDARE
ncbi:MAG: nuclear transport factor 2 family protein [Flavobacteriales bacterium]|nr:nuclear transport factor 2 family protein [Flavobacteriales bacterium]